MGLAREAFLAAWDHENGTSARAIRAMPDGKLDLKPHPKSMSAAELCWHLATSERYFAVGAMGVEAPGEDPVPKERPPSTVAAMAEAFERSHAALRRAAGGKPDAWFEQEVEFYGMRLPRVSVGNLMLRHEAHHRGQLTVYLRLAGSKVPSIYGPTADEPG